MPLRLVIALAKVKLQSINVSPMFGAKLLQYKRLRVDMIENIISHLMSQFTPNGRSRLTGSSLMFSTKILQIYTTKKQSGRLLVSSVRVRWILFKKAKFNISMIRCSS